MSGKGAECDEWQKHSTFIFLFIFVSDWDFNSSCVSRKVNDEDFS